MKKDYFKLYVISSIITFLVNLVFLGLQYKSGQVAGSLYDFVELYKGYPIIIVLVVISFGLFILSISFKRNKFDLDNPNINMIYAYMCFFVIMILLAVLFNCKVVMKNIQFIYYYGFIVVDYFLLSIYTLLSFDLKIDKRKKK